MSSILFCSLNIITRITSEVTACVGCYTGEIPQILISAEDQTMQSFSMLKAVRTENAKYVK